MRFSTTKGGWDNQLDREVNASEPASNDTVRGYIPQGGA